MISKPGRGALADERGGLPTVPTSAKEGSIPSPGSFYSRAKSRKATVPRDVPSGTGGGTAADPRREAGFTGSCLKSLLRAKGISKWKLAKDLKISYRIVQYWEKGRSVPSKKNAERLAVYFDQPTEKDLWADHEARIRALETNGTADAICKIVQDAIRRGQIKLGI